VLGIIGVRAFLWTLIHSCLAKAFKQTASKLDSQDAQAKVKAELESFKAMTHFPSKANNKRGQGLDALFEGKSVRLIYLVRNIALSF